MGGRWSAAARRGTAWITAVLVGATGLAGIPAAPASAHGVLDQETVAGASCDSASYPGSKLVTTGESRQSFVPRLGGLVAVELCIDNLVGLPGADFTVNMYSSDDPANPGSPIASTPVDVGNQLLTAQWVHVEFAAPVDTTPGASYVIGLAPTLGTLSSVSFQWRATCNDGLLTSCAGRPDHYPAGRTSDLPGPADYGIRTFPLMYPDLVADVGIDPAVCPGLDLTGRADGSVHNDSSTSVGAFDTRWLWSADPALDPGDRPLATSTVPGLAAGATAVVPPPVLPADLAAGEGHLLLQLDPDDVIPELGEDANNLAAGPTAVTPCGQPAFEDVTVVADDDSMPAGVNQLQFTDLDPAALATLTQSPQEAAELPGVSPNAFSPNAFSPNAFSPNAFSSNGFSPNAFSPNAFSPNAFSPNGFSPNAFSPNGFSPNAFSPLGAVLLRELLDDLPVELLQRTHVVNIPIAGDTWSDRLEGLVDEPIQNVTLDDAIALLPDLRVDEVDVNRIVSFSILGAAFANGTLSAFPLPEDADWCTFVQTYDFDCAPNDIDPTADSVLALEAAGFPAHQAPIATLTLTDIEYQPDALVYRMPLRGATTIPLDRSPAFSFEHTRVGQLPADVVLGSRASTIFECTTDCDRTLVELAAAGKLLDATVGDFVEALSAEGRASMTVGDLALGAASLNSLRLSGADWNHGSPVHMDPACPASTFRVRATNVGTAGAVDPMVSVRLPAGFDYLPGSALWIDDGAPAVDPGEPAGTIDASGVRTYEFTLDAIVEEDFELSFSACAGAYLGVFDAGEATVSGFGILEPHLASSSSDPALVDDVTVVERTPGVTTNAIVPADNAVIVDHISAADDHDLWTFPVAASPRTLHVVKLYAPTGVDLDLIAYGPADNAATFSPNAFSPNAFSPNAFSPNAFSPNGFSPNAFSPNAFSPNGFSPNGFSTTAPPELMDDLPIEELTPEDSSGFAVSANRGDTTETMYLLNNFGDAGHYSFAVVDYNGTRSDAPYFLTIQTATPTVRDFGPCADAPWELDHPAGAAPEWTAPDGGPRTLFVTNRQVASSVHGSQAVTDGLQALQSLAARPEVRGLVVEADHDPGVRSAYQNWRDNWCDPTAANIAASAVRDVILELRSQYPSIDTVVLVGTDVVVPDFRLTDTSNLANEIHYAETLLRATGTHDALVASYLNATIPSADPYGNDAPLPFATTLAFPPSAGVSRLVETPADWELQVAQYVASDGLLDPAAGVISAYDGMVDGAEAAAEALRGAVPTSTLTDETGPWSAAAFRDALFDPEGPSFGGYNAHANHFAILSALGSANDDESELITTAEVGQIPHGAFIFSNGCHFGTGVADALNPVPDAVQAPRILDWNQAIAQRSGIAVTNSGFGIFDTEVVGQGERLQALFLEELRTAPNAALALATAKNRFFATVGVHDAYSYKTLQQLGMYGLGILRMPGATAPAELTEPTSTHIQAGPYSLDGSSDGYRFSSTPDGERIDLVDSTADVGHTSSNGYWSAPLSTREVVRPADTWSAGVWVDDIEGVTLDDRDLVTTRLAVERAGVEPEMQTAAPFPTSLAEAVDVGGTSFVTLLHGISVPTRMVDGRVLSDVHLYTRIDAELLLRPAGTTGCDPTIDEVTSLRPSVDSDVTLIDVTVDGGCQGVERVGILARDDAGQWTVRDLTFDAATGHWTTAVILQNGATRLEDLLVQASNGVGVGHWRHKGDEPLVEVGYADGVDLALAGVQAPNGVYTGAVEATIVGAPGVVYSVYDNDRLTGSFVDDDTFTVAGDGAHELQVIGSDGSTALVVLAIDGSGPTIEINTPPEGAVYGVGELDVIDVECRDVGTGSTCEIAVDGVTMQDGDPLPTTLGAHTLTVRAVDGTGRVAEASRTYDVQSRYTISAFFSPIAAKPALNRVTTGSNVTVKFTVTDRDGTEVTDPALIATRTWQPISCSTLEDSGTPFDAIGTTPEYSGFFHFNVDAPSRVGCYELVVTLVDGSSQSAYFDVRRR